MLARMTARAILAGIALLCGTGVAAQRFELPEWLDVYKAGNGTVIYMQANGVGAARLGKDIWSKRVNTDGSWLLTRVMVDCEQHAVDIREGITFDKLGNLTDSYREPESQHDWRAITSDSSGSAIEKYACYIPSKKP